jgi:REP element-mobilizing transposase RayT
MGKMFDDHGFPKFETNEFPIAYLITIRTYGTWMHGDARYSVGRNESNGYGRPKIKPSVPFVDSMKTQQREPSVIFGEGQRVIVAEAIKGVCAYRQYSLLAQNIRSNHGHAVVSAKVKPEKIVNEFKSYATRALRQVVEFEADARIWSRGGSTRYLWKPRHVSAAIEYVLYEQGDVEFELE